MKSAIRAVTLAALTAIILGACGEQGSMERGAMQSEAMPGMEGMMATGGGEHVALGTVNSIDRAAGTINVSHEPVESLGWPSMTMQFRLADTDAASAVEPGQQIEFRFTTEEGGTITAIETAQ